MPNELNSAENILLLSCPITTSSFGAFITKDTVKVHCRGIILKIRGNAFYLEYMVNGRLMKYSRFGRNSCYLIQLHTGCFLPPWIPPESQVYPFEDL